MTPEPPPETCPSCHKGVLVGIEEESDGSIRRFSCGQSHHDVRVADISVHLSASLSVEHGLGPHSTETVSHHRSVGGSAFIVSMQQEMYKDALHFYREARGNHAHTEADPFVTWRNLRAAILFSFAAIESSINQFIDAHVDQNRAQMSQVEIDRWTERRRYLGMKEKLNEGVELFGGKRLESDAMLWKNFEELKDLRDGLVHFKVASRLFYNANELLKLTEKGIQTASAVIKKIYSSHPANTAYPKTFDELP